MTVSITHDCEYNRSYTTGQFFFTQKSLKSIYICLEITAGIIGNEMAM